MLTGSWLGIYFWAQFVLLQFKHLIACSGYFEYLVNVDSDNFVTSADTKNNYSPD